MSYEGAYSPWQRILPWLQWYFNSHKRHGIHSPFAYKLSDEVLSVPLNKDTKARLKALYSSLLAVKAMELDHPVNGSLSTQSVKSILRGSASRPKVLQMLQNLCLHFQPQIILELGTNLGIGAACLSASSQPEARIHSIEGSRNLYELAKKKLAENNFSNITLHQGLFSDVLPKLLPQLSPLDLVIIDGHHQELPTLEYFRMLLPYTHDKTVFVLDDIHWSAGMDRAWNTIRMHEGVTLTLDTYQQGIAFRDPQLSRETIGIRY